MSIRQQIEKFAARVERDRIAELRRARLDCEANIINARTTVKFRKKYACVDVGRSGAFMVDLATGEIFGIKGYGKIHRGHRYGTVETANRYHWGPYYPDQKQDAGGAA